MMTFVSMTMLQERDSFLLSEADSQVPYHSLSWCKNWLGPKVNITRTPQVFISTVIDIDV